MNTKPYQAAVYVRRIFKDLLCPDDTDLSSIEQLSIISSYLEQKPDVNYAGAFTDGRSQKQETVLNAFQRLMTQLEAHNYNCLVLYSIEQFSNTAEENRHCLLTLFPMWGIRIICVKEDYDSITSGDNENGYEKLELLLKQAEVAEEARRSKAEFLRKRSKGKTARTYCPYGYVPGAVDTADIIPDPESKHVVQYIFHEYLAGKGLSQIARALTADNIPSPSKRKEQRGYKFENTVAAGYWHPTTVKGLLKNPVYTGDLVFSSYRATMYLSLRDETIRDMAPKHVLKNHHEPLITREDYEKVQLMLEAEDADRPVRTPSGNRFPKNPCRNIIRCSECGALMLYQQRNLNGKNPYVVYICSTGANKGKEHCSRHTTRFDYVNTEIRAAIQEEIDLANAVYNELQETNDSTTYSQVEADYKRQMDGYLDDTRTINQKLQKLHADFTVFSISPEEYYRQKELLTEESREKGRLLTEAIAQLRDYRAIFTLDNPWLKLFYDKALPDLLTQTISKSYIETVLLSPQEKLTIILKHQEWREKLLEGIKQRKETD